MATNNTTSSKCFQLPTGITKCLHGDKTRYSFGYIPISWGLLWRFSFWQKTKRGVFIQHYKRADRHSKCHPTRTPNTNCYLTTHAPRKTCTRSRPLEFHLDPHYSSTALSTPEQSGMSDTYIGMTTNKLELLLEVKAVLIWRQIFEVVVKTSGFRLRALLFILLRTML